MPGASRRTGTSAASGTPVAGSTSRIPNTGDQRPRPVKVQAVAPADAPTDAALPADAVIVARLRDRDEVMFAALLDAWSPGLLRAARAYVRDEHAAQDVVQETWLGVVRGIGSFEARSSLRTWVYRIMINRAKTRGQRDSRSVPVEDLGPTVEPARFRGPDDQYPGGWRSFPEAWPSP